MAVSKQYQAQLQLIAAWLNREERVLEFELGSAAARVGAKIQDINMVVANPASSASAQNQFYHWNAFVRGRSVLDFNLKPGKEFRLLPNGNYVISVYDFVLAIIRKSDRANFGQAAAQYVIYGFSLLNFLIPIIKLLIDNMSSRRSKWLYLFMFTSSIINLSFGFIVYNLLYVAIFGTSLCFCSVRLMYVV